VSVFRSFAATAERCSSASMPSIPWTDAPTMATPAQRVATNADREAMLRMAGQSTAF
jgi:hypothetical protein